MAVRWLRRYGCGVVLSEQACVSGEMPDAIGWKKACHSVLVESKVSRADFLADRGKPFRLRPDGGVGCERYYLVPPVLIRIDELPAGWGLLEVCGREVVRVKASAKNLRWRVCGGWKFESSRRPSPIFSSGKIGWPSTTGAVCRKGWLPRKRKRMDF
jgi:hypothetical protein